MGTLKRSQEFLRHLPADDGTLSQPCTVRVLPTLEHAKGTRSAPDRHENEGYIYLAQAV